MFSCFSFRIQNDLIEAIDDVIRHDTKKDISGAPFVAAKVEETTDVTRRVTRLRHQEAQVAEARLHGPMPPSFIFGGAWPLCFYMSNFS